MSVFVVFFFRVNYRLLSDRNVFHFIHASSSGLIASESHNSWKVKSFYQKKIEKMILRTTWRKYILKPTANWSPYILTLVQKVKHMVYNFMFFK